jgi:hypothetical protein
MYTKEKFIEESRKKHGDTKYDYSKSDYTGSRKYITIICKQPGHGKFEQIAVSHMQGAGCKKCAVDALRMSQEEFEEKVNKIHKNKYTYGKFTGTKKKIKIMCPVDDHGEFFQLAKSHLKGNGCSICSKRVKLTTKSYIKRAKKKYKGKYIYKKTKYIKNDGKIIVICLDHGEFKVHAGNHLYLKSGCPNCSHNKKKTLESFKNEAINMHGDKYNYDDITEFNGVYSKIIVKCNKDNHGKFTIVARYHLKGNGGCKLCKIESVIKAKTKTTEQFIEESIKKYGDNKYNYKDTEYEGSDKKVKIICGVHNHLFEQTPNNHMNYEGCMYCSKSYYKKITKEEFIDEVVKIHGNNYDYSNINFIDLKTPIEIKCNICKYSFKQTPSSHKQGRGCGFCNKTCTPTLEQYIERVSKIHGDKYNYSQVKYIKNNKTKITIHCNCGNIFKQRVGDHYKNGCPKCAKSNFSKKSIKWLDYISDKEDIYIQHAENDGEFKIYIDDKTHLKCDGYSEETNTVYEFNGCIWHGHKCKKCKGQINPINKESYEKLYEKTIERENIIMMFGYNLETIWECEWDKIRKSI